ncbi:MAG: AsmA family protein, partial [Prevotellaceae bacterium]|nr:AsmA family protein [Prevotellaceae bacterium]
MIATTFWLLIFIITKFEILTYKERVNFANCKIFLSRFFDYFCKFFTLKERIIKIVKKIALIIAVFLTLLPFGLALLLQMEPIQSWAVQRATHTLSTRLETEVRVGSVYFIFFNKLILQNVHILSSPNDTLIQVNKLSLTLRNLNPFSKRLTFKKMALNGGVFHLEMEEEGRTNLERVLKIRRDNEKQERLPFAWIVGLEEFSLENFRFTLKNEAKSKHGAFPDVIDFSDLDVNKIQLNIKKVRFERDTLFCTIHHLNAIEKSGYILSKLTGDVSVSSHCAHIKNVFIQDQWSEIKADNYRMHYNSARDFRHFTDSVRLEADFTDALLSFRSLAFYAPAIENNNLVVLLRGYVTGPVRYLQSDALTLHSQSGKSKIDASFRMIGLPNTSITTAFVDIQHLHSTAGDVASIVNQISGIPPDQFTRFIPPSTSVTFRGGIAGLLTDFALNGTIHTDMGDISVDAVLNQEKNQGFYITGSMGTDEFNIQSIMGKPFGTLTMHTHTQALLRNVSRGGMEARIDSLRIGKIEINNYPFSQIFAVGDYKDQRFDGRVVCADPNLNCIFQGLANLNYKELEVDQIAQYDFKADIAYADLSAMGIDIRDSISRISGSVRANFQRSTAGEVVGYVSVLQADYINSSGTYNLGAIHIDSHIQDSAYRFQLTAPFANATYSGSEGIVAFIKDYRHHALSRYLPHYFIPDQNSHLTRHYRLDVTINDMSAIGQLALPGLFIAPKTQLYTELTKSDSLYCTLTSQLVRYKNQRVGNLVVEVSGDPNSLSATVSATDLNPLGIEIDSAQLRCNAGENLVEAHLDYNNYSGDHQGGTINTQIHFGEKNETGDGKIAIWIQPSRFEVNKSIWKLDSSIVLFAPQEIFFDRLKLHNGNQSLTLAGFINRAHTDTLNLALNQFDISLVNLFLQNSPYRFSGQVTGGAQMVDFYQNRQFSMNINADNLFVNDLEAGSVMAKCLWDHEAQSFSIEAKNLLHGETPVTVSGSYHTISKHLNLFAKSQNLSVSYFEPFLSSMISGFNGSLSGEMKLSGTLPNLSLSSNRINANNVGFTVNFTKVPYLLNGDITLNESGFNIQNGRVTDRFGREGYVNGGMKYRYFRDVLLDATFDFQNFHSLSIKEKDNNAFYGEAFATGQLHAYGSLKQITLDIRAKTEKNTSIHVPLLGVSEARQSTILSFASHPDHDKTVPILGAIETLDKAIKVKEPTQLTLKLAADVTPDAELKIEVNKATGNVISGYGSGN